MVWKEWERGGGGGGDRLGVSVGISGRLCWLSFFVVVGVVYLTGIF